MRYARLTLYTALFAFLSCTVARAETYTGRLEGTGAFIAVITGSDKLVAYTCDGFTLAQWFRATPLKTPLELASTDGQSRLKLRLSARLVTGSLEFGDGGVFRFKAARSSGDSGLYRSETLKDGVGYVGGWVVLENGEQRGSIMGGGPVRPAGLLRLTGGAKAVLEGLGELSPFMVNEVWVSNRVQ